MKHLVIIGARGFGREVYNLAMECIEAGEQMDVKGFLDDKADALDNYQGYPAILGFVEEYVPQSDDVFICAMGEPIYKKKYAEMILAKGGEFINIIHPSALIRKNTTIGKGCIFTENVALSCDAKIGDFVTIMANAVLGHDVQVGSWSHIGAGSFMGGFSKIGELVTLHPHVELLPHKTVKDSANVGAGSVVLRNVKEGTTVFGIPATKMEI